MWLELVEKSITVSSVFKHDEVTLDEVRLNAITIAVYNGWTFRIGFDVKQYPSSPPIKWQKANYNTVSIGLDFLDNEILFFQNSNFALEKGQLLIEIDGLFKKVTFIASESKDIIFILRCRWIMVNGIAAYCKDTSGEYY